MDAALETCIRCGDRLSQDTKFCPNCGLNLAGSGTNSQPPHGNQSHFPGPNRLLFRQTPAESLLEASFTDATAQQLAEVIHTLVAGNVLRTPAMKFLASRETGENPELIEATAEIQPHTEAGETPAPQNNSLVAGDITKIFGVRNGTLKLLKRSLKAKTAKEHAIRLTRMFLHYKQQGGMHEVEKQEVYDFLKNMGVKRSDYQPVISRDECIDKTKTTLHLNNVGEQQVEDYLRELDDPQIEEGWYPGKGARTSSSRKRRASKRSSDQQGGKEPSIADLNEDVKHLQERVKARHEDVVKWKTGDLALLGLYALRKQYGDEHDATYREVAHFLYSTFELSVVADTLRKALDRLRDSNEKHVNPGQNGGYRISPSGMKHIKDKLKTEQPELVTADSVGGSNGASQA